MSRSENTREFAFQKFIPFTPIAFALPVVGGLIYIPVHFARLEYLPQPPTLHITT